MYGNVHAAAVFCVRGKRTVREYPAQSVCFGAPGYFDRSALLFYGGERAPGV